MHRRCVIAAVIGVGAAVASAANAGDSLSWDLTMKNSDVLAPFDWPPEKGNGKSLGSKPTAGGEDRGIAPVPLPSAALLGAVGLGTMAGLRRRRPNR